MNNDEYKLAISIGRFIGLVLGFFLRPFVSFVLGCILGFVLKVIMGNILVECFNAFNFPITLEQIPFIIGFISLIGNFFKNHEYEIYPEEEEE